MLRERLGAPETVTWLFSWSILHIIFSTSTVSWLHMLYFDFPQFTQNACAKFTFSWNFRRSVKEAMILILPRYFVENLEINLSLLPQISCLKVYYSGNIRSSIKEAVMFTAWKVSKYGVISGRNVPIFGLTEIFSVNLLIQSKYRKIRTRNNFTRLQSKTQTFSYW